MTKKSIVITGAGSGIGLATTLLHLAAGWHVFAVDRNKEALEHLSERADGGSVSIHAMDITDATAIENLTQIIDESEHLISGLVNCAGIGANVPYAKTTADMMRNIYEVNVIAAFILIQAIAPLMEKCGGGSIVNIVSVSGIKGSYGRSAYGASKGALITLTKVLCVELADAGIRVNAVAPGPVETIMSREHHTEETREEWRRTLPMRRYAEPEEIAEAAFFLNDENRASYITGQVLCVDGGFVSAGLMK
ncbi:MAG: SDR family NAD(P)-dependent oxidoreductase [Alphaproteobacteria bacterium]|nr:SDR family NAD(P)-dependent oxidoreductase [Alphaproteobacteria bacterium]